MPSLYTREIVGDCHCLFLTVDRVKRLISTSRANTAPSFGPTLQKGARAQQRVVGELATPTATIPPAPARFELACLTLVAIRRGAETARLDRQSPLALPPAKSRGHLAFHAGREFVSIGRTIHIASADSPIRASGFRRDLRPLETLNPFQFHAVRNQARMSCFPQQRVVGQV